MTHTLSSWSPADTPAGTDTAPPRRAPALEVVEGIAPAPPAWVEALLEPAVRCSCQASDSIRLDVADRGDLCWIQATVVDAAGLGSRAFETRVSEVYAVLRHELAQRRASHPIRFWNFVPGIHRPAHDGMDHYETFNAGRFAAFARWYGTRELGPHMVAASGVGHRAADFVVQVLAHDRPGHGLENPRQIAAWRYSQRYGPLPPCFARATRVALLGRDHLLVAGTASVVGEDSTHLDNLRRQVDETCVNLCSLLGQAGSACLSRFRQLRAYVVDSATRPALIDLLTERFPDVEQLELMDVELCRRDLLVEVEGVVRI